jgi:putative phosphonate metabolism protein
LRDRVGNGSHKEHYGVEGAARYAIYFVPEEQSDLYRCGSAIIGYDCYAGRAVDFPDALKCDALDWDQFTNEPRRYGFHATLKAPFPLRQPHPEAQLVDALHNFARHREPVRVAKPTVRLLRDFIAVVPSEPVPPLDALAASCTTCFDSYRAPMSPQERDRRMAAGLSDRQIENLDRWGYPYALSDFRFHMTLTGKVEEPQHKTALALLNSCVQRMGGDRAFLIDRLTLVKQDSPQAFFKIVSQAVLGGG